MILVDTGSGLNFISAATASSLDYPATACNHKTVAFNDQRSSLTQEICIPVVFCAGTPDEISVWSTFVVAPNNSIFDILLGTPLLGMDGVAALPDVTQQKLTLRPFLHLPISDPKTLDLPFKAISRP